MTIPPKSLRPVADPEGRIGGEPRPFTNLAISWPPKFVRLCKVGEVPQPLASAVAPTDYRYGALNSAGSLPILYTLDGWLLGLPRVGEPVLVLRFARNGVIMPGVFSSTEVMDVPRDGEFVTLNSIYHWQEVSPFLA